MSLKKTKLFQWLFICFGLFSCGDDDKENMTNIVITVSDFEVTTDENPVAGQSLGQVIATINKGSLSYKVISQTPSNAVNVNNNTGELTVNDEDVFNFEVNQVITGTMDVFYVSEKKTINFTININDVVEPLDYSLVESTSEVFQKRELHQAIEFKNKLWVIGGEGSTQYYNDIWSSLDGIKWSQVSATNSFTTTNGHQAIVFKDKLWLIGGRNIGNVNNEIWVSDNGSDWTEIIPEGEYFEPVIQHRLIVFKEKLWLIGGWKNNNLNSSNEVWNTNDGITWEQVNTTSQKFSPRAAHEVIVFKDKLWLIGGYDGLQDNEIWSTSDGIDWEKIEVNDDYFIPRSAHQLVVLQDKLWLIGGWDETWNASNEVWSSSDGVNWSKENISFSKIHNHQSLVFNNKIWVIAGSTSNQDSGLLNSIWHTN